MIGTSNRQYVFRGRSRLDWFNTICCKDRVVLFRIVRVISWIVLSSETKRLTNHTNNHETKTEAKLKLTPASHKKSVLKRLRRPDVRRGFAAPERSFLHWGCA